MANRRPIVVVTDCDHSSLELERKVLDEISPEFVVAHCTTEEEVIEAARPPASSRGALAL
ncbi:MAG: hypothetical protein GH144_05805 [Clostridia bacterium]|jgi:D-3-phosphoglycerate dehydrogenase|nr:hypothetical protein [Clostridia bacterium]